LKLRFSLNNHDDTSAAEAGNDNFWKLGKKVSPASAAAAGPEQEEPGMFA
jgi:hypothetical protein